MNSLVTTLGPLSTIVKYIVKTVHEVSKWTTLSNAEDFKPDSKNVR